MIQKATYVESKQLFTKYVQQAGGPWTGRHGESGTSACRSCPQGVRTPAVAPWMCQSQTAETALGQPGQMSATLARTTGSEDE